MELRLRTSRYHSELPHSGFIRLLPTVGSRREEDKRWALDRMARAGVSLTTAEASVFEWTKVAGTPTFKQISELIKKNDQLAGK